MEERPQRLLLQQLLFRSRLRDLQHGGRLPRAIHRADRQKHEVAEFSENSMNGILFTLTLATMLASLATGQNNKTALSAARRAYAHPISAQAASETATLGKPPRIPSFCPPSDCLYYAG